MATTKLNQALDNVEMTYGEIVNISNDMLGDILTPIDALIHEIRINSNSMSIENIRDYMIRLQLRAYEISEIKEKSLLKAQCAEAIRKESYAKSFNEANGTQGIKDNIATIETSEEIIVEALYNLVANLLKTRMDSLYRMIDTLKSILMSKMQEAKLTMNAIE